MTKRQMKKSANRFGEIKPYKGQIVHLFVNSTFNSVQMGNSTYFNIPQKLTIDGDKAFYKGNFWRILDSYGNIIKQVQTSKDDLWFPVLA
jgi:hypothetical protein